MHRVCTAMLLVFAPSASAAQPPESAYDVIIRGGAIYDGAGGAPYTSDIALSADRIAAIAPHSRGHGETKVDARGRAVSPGFYNMLVHPEESLIADGRGLSDPAQGVTLEEGGASCVT